MDFKDVQPSICILLFFIVLFFIYHIYYKYKPVYEGFSSNSFREGFRSNMNESTKTKLTHNEISKRGHHNLPHYKYKEDIPQDEINKETHNPNNSSSFKGDESIIQRVEEKLNSGNFILNKLCFINEK